MTLERRRTGSRRTPEVGVGLEPQIERTHFSAEELVDFLTCPACSQWRSRRPERRGVLSTGEAQLSFLKGVAAASHLTLQEDSLFFRQPRDLIAYADRSLKPELRPYRDFLKAELLVYYFNHWRSNTPLFGFWTDQNTRENSARFIDGERDFYAITSIDQIRRSADRPGILQLWKLKRGLTSESFPLAIFEAGIQTLACCGKFGQKGEPSMSGAVFYDFSNGACWRCTTLGNESLLRMAVLATIDLINSGYSDVNPDHDHCCPNLQSQPQGRMGLLPKIIGPDETAQRLEHQAVLKLVGAYAKTCFLASPELSPYSIIDDDEGVWVQLRAHRINGCAEYLACSPGGVVSCPSHGEVDWLAFSKR